MLSNKIFILGEKDPSGNLEYIKLKREKEHRPLSKDELTHLEERKARKDAYVLGEGDEQDYKFIAKELAKAFLEKGTTSALVCGGYDHYCITNFLTNMHEASKDLELMVVPKFFVYGNKIGRFSKSISDEEGIHIKTIRDENEFLNLL